ncbi:hypothetical protein AB0F90_08980 [Micromonospora chalcea]|uniref:hypothetical protein n=1 Tax=Micromonospora TaxID=1873 RepID=UPI001B371F11|nr:hypothetical protein [Micromonospora sp. C41]MBQ1061968.1 hypothetical protein [Micromonospora sp. C41]
MIEVGVTAVATLCAVVLGGWLTLRGQDRLWRRDTERQWRDIRLKAYTDFLTAMRELVAYLLTPTAVVTAVPRQSGEGDDMPFFDERGTRHKERLEATKSAIRLVAGTATVVEATDALVRRARLVAVARAEHGPDAIPPERFTELWAAERAFLRDARAEVGLVRPSDQ